MIVPQQASREQREASGRQPGSQPKIETLSPLPTQRPLLGQENPRFSSREPLRSQFTGQTRWPMMDLEPQKARSTEKE